MERMFATALTAPVGSCIPTRWMGMKLLNSSQPIQAVPGCPREYCPPWFALRSGALTSSDGPKITTSKRYFWDQPL